MARHRLSPEAEAELDEIWFHAAGESGSIELADHIIDNITERFWLLAQRPHIGRARDDLRHAASWWLANRPKAPEAFKEELQRAFDLISQPGVGARATNVENGEYHAPRRE